MPFKKGQSGNPKGSKKGSYIKELSMSAVVRRKLSDIHTIDEYEEAVARVENIAEKIIHIAESTDDPKILHDFAVFLRDTTEGKPSQRVELAGDKENPIALVISKANE